VVLTFAAAVVSPVDTPTAVAVVLAAPVLMVVASVPSVGIGMAFPRFDAVNIPRSRETVVPSLLAFAPFSLHLGGTTFSAVVIYDEEVPVWELLCDWST
jgi:hypothetical protein